MGVADPLDPSPNRNTAMFWEQMFTEREKLFSLWVTSAWVLFTLYEKIFYSKTNSFA